MTFKINIFNKETRYQVIVELTVVLLSSVNLLLGQKLMFKEESRI